MSIQAIVYALGLRDGPHRDSVTPAERLTIVSIANRVNPDYGNECFLPTSTIAAEVGVSERTLQRIFDALEGKGLLGRTPHVRDDGSQTTNTYSLPDFEHGRWEMDDGAWWCASPRAPATTTTTTWRSGRGPTQPPRAAGTSTDGAAVS